MRSYPYNVILSKSLKDIRSMFFGLGLSKAQLSKYLDPQFSSNLKDTFIISQKNNKGFIELEFDRAFSQKKFQIVMKFVETSEIIEFFAFNNDPIESVIKDDIINQIRNADTEEARNKLVFKYLEYIGTFYLAFGMGDDITNWTGPVALSLANAHLSVREDGIREVEFIFTPDSNSFKLYHNMSLASLARTKGTEGYGKVRSSKLITTAVQKFNHDGTKPEPNAAGNRWNYQIRQLLIKYLSEIYTDIPLGNILPLFSKDLDLDGKNEDAAINISNFSSFRNISDLASNFKSFGIILNQESEGKKTTSAPMPESTQKVMASKGLAPDPNNPPAAAPAAAPSSNKEALIQSLIENPSELIPFDKGLSDSDRSRIVRERKKQRQRDAAFEAYLRGDLENPLVKRELARLNALGARAQRRERALILQNKEEIGKNQEVLDKIQSSSKVVSTPSNTNIDSALETDKDTSSERKPGVAKMTMRSVDNEGKGSITDALNNFSKALIYDGQKTTDIVLIEESDLFVLKSLKENGLIENDTCPVILFGDRNIIRNLVYSIGETNTNDKVTLPPTTNVVVSYENQPAEDMIKAWQSHIESLRGSFGDRGNTSCYRENPFPDRMMVSKETRNLLTFAHNVKNSNILNIELNDDMFYSHFKNLLIDSEVRTHAANIKLNQILKDMEVNLEEIVNYLRRNLVTVGPELPVRSPQDIRTELVRKLYDKPDEGLIELITSKEDVASIDVLDFVDIITFMLGNRGIDDIKKSVGTVKVVPHNVSRGYADLIYDLRRLTRSITLKTLPFFNHGFSLFNSDCFVYALGNSVKGSNNTKELRKTPAFFSGKYQIVGYRHVISLSDAYSEFRLLKSGDSTSNELGSHVRKSLADFLKDREVPSTPNVLDLNFMGPDLNFMGPPTLEKLKSSPLRKWSPTRGFYN